MLSVNTTKKKIFFRIEEAIKLSKSSGPKSLAGSKSSAGQKPSSAQKPSSVQTSSSPQTSIALDSSELRRRFHQKFLKKEVEIEKILLNENFNSEKKSNPPIENTPINAESPMMDMDCSMEENYDSDSRPSKYILPRTVTHTYTYLFELLTC